MIHGVINIGGTSGAEPETGRTLWHEIAASRTGQVVAAKAGPETVHFAVNYLSGGLKEIFTTGGYSTVPTGIGIVRLRPDIGGTGDRCGRLGSLTVIDGILVISAGTIVVIIRSGTGYGGLEEKILIGMNIGIGIVAVQWSAAANTCSNRRSEPTIISVGVAVSGGTKTG